MVVTRVSTKQFPTTQRSRSTCLRDDPATVQLLAGHGSIETTEPYIDGDTCAQRRLVAYLWGRGPSISNCPGQTDHEFGGQEFESLGRVKVLQVVFASAPNSGSIATRLSSRHLIIVTSIVRVMTVPRGAVAPPIGL